jgi:quinol-cytochrome oxidoreductase complex cytochrome b subunit
MIVVLRLGVTPPEVDEVSNELARRGLQTRRVESSGRTLLHIVSGPTRRARPIVKLEQVEAIVPTSGPRVRREGRRFYPYHFVNWSAFGVALLGVLVFLAGMFPAGIGEEIDQRFAPESLPTPWYLQAPLTFIGLFPPALAWLGWTIFALGGVLLFALPFIDRSTGKSARGFRIVVGILLAAFLLASVKGVLA